MELVRLWIWNQNGRWKRLYDHRMEKRWLPLWWIWYQLLCIQKRMISKICWPICWQSRCFGALLCQTKNRLNVCLSGFFEWSIWDLNPWPLECHSSALPTAPMPQANVSIAKAKENVKQKLKFVPFKFIPSKFVLGNYFHINWQETHVWYNEGKYLINWWALYKILKI